MLTPFEVQQKLDRQVREQRALTLKAQAAQRPDDGQDWLAARMFDGDPSAGASNLPPGPEIPRGPAEREDPGPAAARTPSEILRELQRRQVAGVVTARLPGPGGWPGLELSMPGGAAANGPGLAVKADVPTPQHAAAEAANQYAGDAEENAEAQRRRSRIQHEAEPFAGGNDGRHMDEAALADLGKRFRGAADVADTPSGYPPMRPVSAEQFRDGPITADHASYGAAYEASPRVVPVPTAVITAAAITRPLLTDGHAATSPGG